MPRQLDPRFAMDAYSVRVAGLVFASLVTPDPHGGYTPYLAERWEWPDSTTCRFVLRGDLTFHDGTPIGSRDVVATYRALMDPAVGSPHRALLERVVAVEAMGERAVEFRLDRPDAAFLEAAALAVLPADQAAAGRADPLDLTGSGPYRLEQVRADEAVLLAAVDAPGRPSSDLRAIRFDVVPDELMRAIEIVHDDVDLVQNAIDPDTVEWIARTQPQLAVLRGPSSNFQYLGVNLTDPRLADVRIRRALALAIDRQAIVEHVLAGQATVATGLLPPSHWAYSARVREYRYDPARARRLLDRAGLVDPDGPGPAIRTVFSYKTTTQELPRRTANAIAAQLAQVGIGIEILTHEWGTFFDDVRRGNFQLYSLQWVGITDPDIYRQVFHSAQIPPAGNNRGRYRDVVMDRLTERGSRVLDLAKRKRIYARVQRRAAHRLPYIPLWWPERVVVTTRRLHGFQPTPSGDLLGLHAARLDGTEPQAGIGSGSGSGKIAQGP